MKITLTSTELFGIVNTEDGKTFCVDCFGDVYLRTKDGMTKLNSSSMTISEMNNIRGVGLFELRRDCSE